MKRDFHSRDSSIIPPPECIEAFARGALFVVNHSGGKDSQTMTIALRRLVPPDQLLIVHAPLGDVEWPGTVEHIENTIPPGVPLVLAPTASAKTLLERIEERGRFPDSARRWCTSDFKRTPIEREIRRYLKGHPRYSGRIVNCLGLRAEESPTRARRPAWSFNARNSKAGREWHDWLPIFRMTRGEVFKTIRQAGQTPHWAYAAGMTRLSCSFCILASRSDLATAARLRPALYRRYAALERRIGHTLSPARNPLPEITGISTPDPFPSLPQIRLPAPERESPVFEGRGAGVGARGSARADNPRTRSMSDETSDRRAAPTDDRQRPRQRRPHRPRRQHPGLHPGS